MKRGGFFLTILLLAAALQAQYFFYDNRYYDAGLLLEIGVGIGGMNALTDLGGKKGDGRGFIKDLNLKNTKPSFSASLTATYRSAVAFRVEFTAGNIVSYDSILKNVASTTKRYDRNLSFRSPVVELMAGAEIHPLFFIPREEEPPRASPYILGGAGYFRFNPQAKLEGIWHDLHPLRLEGQGFAEYPGRKPYKLNQFNFAAGIGIRYEINHLLNVRFEIIHRKLNTDYLDDVSTRYINPVYFSNYLSAAQAALAARLYDRRGELNPNHTPKFDERGDPEDNDSYFTVMLKIGFTIRQKIRN